jgi:hypothetical protein
MPVARMTPRNWQQKPWDQIENPSYLIPDFMVARSVRDWRGNLMVGAAGGGGEVLFMREQYSRLLFIGRWPEASAHGRARGGFVPSNSCLVARMA